MVNLFVEGPDAPKLLSYLGINSFANFTVDKAKQFVPCTYDGYVIGDGILFYLAENSLVFVGRAPAANWIQFHGETGGYNVKVTYDDRSPGRPMGKAVVRALYRYQIQGPQAKDVINKLYGGQAPDIKFFNMGVIKIAGRRGPRAASRHGGCPWPRDLGPIRGGRGDPHRHSRCGQGVRHRAGRFAGVRLEHARVGLDPVAAARRSTRTTG